ncbi:MAG TPA: flagellar filament capping protein FliD [Burkholderiaceae bacterium]|jgi:flagellar hook-associated protein 2|nr:flagellar filament capping protein FliD [Burkholderiaceae bacterium]
MTIAGTTSNSLASLLSSTLNSVNANNSSGGSSTSITGSPISTGPIDVNTLVSELIAADSVPMNQLKSQVSGVQSQLSAYGQIQSAMSSLQTAVSSLAVGSAFSAEQATVTGSGVGATVTGTPPTGTYSIGVSQLASAQSAASAPVANASTVLGTGTLTIQLGTYNSTGNTFTPQSSSSPVNITIDSTNNTLGGIAAAINAAGAGVAASVVSDNSGSRLVLTSTNTGASNAFSLSVADSDGTNTDTTGLSQIAFDPTATAGAGKNLTLTQSAQDAKYSVNGLNLTSSSNVVTTAVNGLTLNLTQAPAAGSTLQAQVTVATDSSSVTSSVDNFVQSYNTLVKLEQSLTAYNSTTKTASVLTGDTTARQISSQLASILGSQLSGGASGYRWLANVGIDFNKDGTLTLNSTAFANAIASNPSAVSQMFTSVSGTGSQQGFATQLNTAITSMLSPNGLLSGAQTSLQSTITRMDQQVTQMQGQLSQEQTQLIAQYSHLNANLVVAQQQQVALANALASLPA